jgi:hypothetical protein
LVIKWLFRKISLGEVKKPYNKAINQFEPNWDDQPLFIKAFKKGENNTVKIRALEALLHNLQFANKQLNFLKNEYKESKSTLYQKKTEELFHEIIETERNYKVLIEFLTKNMVKKKLPIGLINTYYIFINTYGFPLILSEDDKFQPELVKMIQSTIGKNIARLEDYKMLTYLEKLLAHIGTN